MKKCIVGVMVIGLICGLWYLKSSKVGLDTEAVVSEGTAVEVVEIPIVPEVPKHIIIDADRTLEAILSVEEYDTLVLGSWKSDDDALSMLVFEENGVTRDIYNGEEVSVGVWEMEINTDDELISLKKTVDEEEFLYTLVSVNNTELALIYLGRGNTLSYTRVSE